MYKQSNTSWNHEDIFDTPRLEQPFQPFQPANSAVITTGDEYFQFYAVPKQAHDSNPYLRNQFSETESPYSNTERICATNSESNDKVTTIPIRAPVPLLYSQRDKAGLKAMESIAQKGTRTIASFDLAPNK